jgi:hypothetical protein
MIFLDGYYNLIALHVARFNNKVSLLLVLLVYPDWVFVAFLSPGKFLYSTLTSTTSFKIEIREIEIVLPP